MPVFALASMDSVVELTLASSCLTACSLTCAGMEAKGSTVSGLGRPNSSGCLQMMGLSST